MCVFYCPWVDKINMIETENLPFSYEDYFSEVENLELLRDNIKNLAQRDIDSLEGLLTSVQETLNLQLDPKGQPEMSEIKRKQIEFQLFKQLSEQNRERSEQLADLARLIMHMIDFIEQSQHRYAFLAESYQNQIDTLRQSIQDLKCGKSSMENDVQMFKEQLERTSNQLQILLEEKEEGEEYQIEMEYDTEQKDNKIEKMEQQLDSLRDKLNFYKRTHQKGQVSSKKIPTMKYTFSEHRLAALPHLHQQHLTDYSHYVEFNKVLVAQNTELKRRIQELELFKMNPTMKETATSQTYQQGKSDYPEQEKYPVYQPERKTLHNIRSKQSFSSHLERNNSSSTIHLECWNSDQPPRQRLSGEIGRNPHEYDLVPENLCHQVSKKLIYLTDDEPSLCQDYSRQKLDNFFDRNLATVLETKESERSAQPNINKKSTRNIKICQAKGVKPSRFIPVKKQEKGSLDSQKGEEQKSSNLFQFLNGLINKRVKRGSAKAKSGYPSFWV